MSTATNSLRIGLERLPLISRTPIAAWSDLRLQQELAALHSKSFSWALSCCRYQPTEAEDVLHETYLKVLDGRARFDGRSIFKTWLFAVIRRTGVDRYRRSWLSPRGWFSPEEEPARPDGVVEDNERRRDVRAALGRLAKRQREVLELVFYQELTVEQAAEVMGIGVGSARVHYHRAKQRLARDLGEP